MAGYRLTEPALEDLTALATFLSDHHGAEAAEIVLADLEEALRALAEAPGWDTRART